MTGGLALKRAEVFEPTCTICGLTGGLPGARLQDRAARPRPAPRWTSAWCRTRRRRRSLAKLRAHLDAEGFGDVEIVLLGGEAPGRVDPDHPFIKLVVDAARGIYDHEMLVVPMIGGSGPNHAFIEQLGVPIATAGVGHPGSRAHAPNENMRLDLFEKGIRHTARILAQFGAQ